MIRFTGALGAAALLAAAAMGAARAETIVFNSFAPPKFIINNGMIDVWAKNVERVTEGRVKVQIPAKSLAAPQQQWEMVTQGVADAAYIFNAFAFKRLMLPQLAHLPFGSSTAEAEGVALWRTHKKYFEPANEYKGVHLLGYFGSTSAHIWSLDKPLTRAADFKELKLWSLPGDQARSFAALGAVVVPGPAVRSYEIISKGIVAAYGGQSYDSAYAFNIAQFAKHVTHVPGGQGSAAFSVFMNEKKWNSIPARDRDLITSVSGEELGKLCRAWDDLGRTALKRLETDGKIERHIASDEFMVELRKTWAFLDDEWLAKAAQRHVDGKAALAYYRGLTKELGDR